MNGGPLSLRATLGKPWVAKILVNLLIVPVAAVDFTMSTSGNREYASIATELADVGNGPQKSIWTVCQGSGGDICRGQDVARPITLDNLGNHILQCLIFHCCYFNFRHLHGYCISRAEVYISRGNLFLVFWRVLTGMSWHEIRRIVGSFCVNNWKIVLL